MPDISICTNRGCHLRGECLRYLAAPGRWQSYIHASPDGDACSLQIKKDWYPFPTLTLEKADEGNVVEGEDG